MELLADPTVNFRFDDYELRPRLRQLLHHGRPLPLGARAFDLLHALVEHRDRVLGHEELLALCWPLALLLLFAWPILWLLSIPFRIVGYALGGVLAFVKALFFLPARLLGAR